MVYPTNNDITTGRIDHLQLREFILQSKEITKHLSERINQSEINLKQAEARTTTMVRKAWFELDRASREISLYQKTVIHLSQSALDVSTRGYESGSVTFADVIGSYTIWLDARLALERKRSDLGIAWAEMERILGTSFR